MFKKFAGDIEVKKIVDKFVDQQEDIPLLQEQGQPPLQEHGHQFKNMMNIKWKIMNNKKKKFCSNHYKRFNLKIHHHSWFADLLGLLSLLKSILPQIIFY